MARTTIPQTRSLLLKNHYLFDTVEQWNSHTRRRRDYCNFADVLAYGPFSVLHEPRPGVLAIQTCAASTAAAHLDKLSSGEIGNRVFRWLLTGNRLEIWGWRKRTRRRRGLAPILVPSIWRLCLRSPTDSQLYYQRNSEVLWLPDS